MLVNTKQKLPIKLWFENEADLESGAWDQVKNLANYPFAYKHIAIMPDCHQGYGMPIGGVMATQDVIVPNAVGVDIGCGMCAVKTSLTEINTDTLKKIMGEIRQAVPVGFKKHKEAQNENLMPKGINTVKKAKNAGMFNLFICENKNIQDNALRSLGTLGGGNHFIEIQKGDDGHIWIMIHSGSRNLGFKVANHYNKLAVELNEKWKSSVLKSWELAFLPLNSDEGGAYLREMSYCVDFALANRKLMMDRILEIFDNETKRFNNITAQKLIGSVEPIINIAHNYASLENHFGKNVWVHRKGATLAREGTIGIIPGSQGTKSYIVKGKGNKESFESCSHGAGRLMGRSQAKKTLDLEQEIKKLNDQGIIHSVRGVQNLDEAPGSYKDIKTVMKNQADLVEVLVELSPLAVIKG